VSGVDPDDIVTVVDRQVEERLSIGLTELVPAASIIGEEAAHRRPELLDLLASDGPLWVIDPIDGTKNFVRGDDGFGIMVAFVMDGHVQAAWISLPARKQTFVAEAGSGAFLNGVRIRVPRDSVEVFRGNLLVRYMPAALRQAVTDAMREHFRDAPRAGCAAIEYTDILRGESEFVVYYRLLPWDHAAPACILTEAGGRVVHLDGSVYTARSKNQLTIVARDAFVANQVRAWLTFLNVTFPDSAEALS
jgi:fructose-1,6-bisphosphatase/inositol monophosphatase family enzyme